jgi:hypothetical protein
MRADCHLRLVTDTEPAAPAERTGADLIPANRRIAEAVERLMNEHFRHERTDDELVSALYVLMEQEGLW